MGAALPLGPLLDAFNDYNGKLEPGKLDRTVFNSRLILHPASPSNVSQDFSVDGKFLFIII